MAYYFNQLRDYAQNTFYTQNTKNKVAEFNAPLFVETDTVLLWFITLETVEIDTPAAFATSLIVTI